MSAYIVSYDLVSPGQNYEALYKAIKSYGNHYHMMESVWLISTIEKATAIRDKLRQHVDGNDKLFVGKLTGEAAWSNLDGGLVKKTLN